MSKVVFSKAIFVVGIILAVALSSIGTIAATGLTSQQGPQGPQGVMGPSGEPGPKGDTGVTGQAGPAGSTGATGLQGAKGDTGATGLQGPTGNATRYVIEGYINTTQNGDLIDGDAYNALHWKRIIIPQLTLNDMPSVEVYIKSTEPANVTIDGQRTTIQPWVRFHQLIGNPDGTIYDEGALYLYYKNTSGNSTYTAITGEYKIVVIK